MGVMDSNLVLVCFAFDGALLEQTQPVQPKVTRKKVLGDDCARLTKQGQNPWVSHGSFLQASVCGYAAKSCRSGSVLIGHPLYFHV